MRNYASIYNFATFCHKNYTFCYNSTRKCYENHKNKTQISTFRHTSPKTSAAFLPPQPMHSSAKLNQPDTQGSYKNLA